MIPILTTRVLNIISANTYDYRKTDYLLQFTDEELQQALDHMNQENSRRTLARRQYIAQELARRLEDDPQGKPGTDYVPFKSQRQADEFSGVWNAITKAIRRKAGWE